MKRVELGAGEMACVQERDIVLAAPSLGSTLALCARDGAKGVVGMAIFAVPQLPEGIEPLEELPALGAATGLQRFFKLLVETGAQVAGTSFWLVGATQFMSSFQDFSLGSQLYTTVKKILEKNSVALAGEHVGGVRNRGVTLAVEFEAPKVQIGKREESL